MTLKSDVWMRREWFVKVGPSASENGRKGNSNHCERNSVINYQKVVGEYDFIQKRCAFGDHEQCLMPVWARLRVTVGFKAQSLSEHTQWTWSANSSRASRKIWKFSSQVAPQRIVRKPWREKQWPSTALVRKWIWSLLRLGCRSHHGQVACIDGKMDSQLC